MKMALGCGAVLLAFVLIIGLWLMGSYNGLVTASQGVDQSWAQVQNVYQRRADLIPNLVSTVKGAANFEKSTLEAVTNARASVGRVTIDAKNAPDDAQKLQEYQAAQGQLTQALSHLMAISENYPDLKATQNFRDLQAQLEGTENRISVERGRFNDAVQAYNIKCSRFPTALIAGMAGFHPKPYFEATAGAATPPTVDFGSTAPAK